MLKSNGKRKQSRLGSLLIEKQIISRSQLAAALKQQSETNQKLGEVLIQQKLITRRQLTKILCRQKWLRSAIASVALAAVPCCPVLASEKSSLKADSNLFSNTQISFNSQKAVSEDVFHSFHTGANPTYASVDAKQGDFSLDIKHQLSNGTGLEFSLNKSDSGAFQSDAQFIPEISFFSSSQHKTKQSNAYSRSKIKQRSDRYKDTLPAVYRVTLKGYALYQRDDKFEETMGLDKVKNLPFKDYELMFSITKQF